MIEKENIEIYKSIMKNNDDEAANTYEMCKNCPREVTCCEDMPGEISPSDLAKVDKETIMKLLNTGLVTIDHWEGDIEGKEDYYRIPYLRMASVEDTFQIFDLWTGKCKALGENGCIIPFHNRAKYCRIGNCKTWNVSGKEESVKGWREYHDLLVEIEEELLTNNPNANTQVSGEVVINSLLSYLGIF